MIMSGTTQLYQHISGHRSLQSLQEYLDVDKEEVVDKFRQRMEVAA